MSDRKVTILNWLTQLKHLTRQTSEPVTRDKLASYAAMLLSEFDATAFTRDSLNVVAEQSEFFPSFAILRAMLQDHLDGQEERQRRISGASGNDFFPKWLHEIVMRNCGGQPGPMLQRWLDGKRIEQ